VCLIIRFMERKDPLGTTALPGIDPRREDEAAGSGGLHVSLSPESAKEFLILVVDDSADNVAMLSLYLQQQGYRVVTATDGEDAISVASSTLPNLILMDISMPRLDGLGATRKIRENDVLRNVPVIAVTAFGTEGFQRAAYDVGVSGYLTKPIDFARMHQLIARLLSPEGSGRLRGL
jgi:CheY-like chemotaxis protein